MKVVYIEPREFESLIMNGKVIIQRREGGISLEERITAKVPNTDKSVVATVSDITEGAPTQSRGFTLKVIDK